MSKIPTWALGPHTDVDEGVEVRPNPDGTIDEVVIMGGKLVCFHLEQMSDGQYFIGLDWIDDAGVEREQKLMLTHHRNHIFPTVYR